MRHFLLLLAAVTGCVTYDDRLAPLSGGDGDGDAAAITQTPCADPREAQLSVVDFAFIVHCGCVEPPGVYAEDDRRCTVPAGTSVTWVFEGSQQHNVSSQSFDESRPRTAGRHSVTFATPGVYPYGCSLHAGQMSGYSIVVK